MSSFAVAVNEKILTDSDNEISFFAQEYVKYFKLRHALFETIRPSMKIDHDEFNKLIGDDPQEYIQELVRHSRSLYGSTELLQILQDVHSAVEINTYEIDQIITNNKNPSPDNYTFRIYQREKYDRFFMLLYRDCNKAANTISTMRYNSRGIFFQIFTTIYETFFRAWDSSQQAAAYRRVKDLIVNQKFDDVLRLGCTEGEFHDPPYIFNYHDPVLKEYYEFSSPKYHAETLDLWKEWYDDVGRQNHYDGRSETLIWKVSELEKMAQAGTLPSPDDSGLRHSQVQDIIASKKKFHTIVPQTQILNDAAFLFAFTGLKHDENIEKQEQLFYEWASTENLSADSETYIEVLNLLKSLESRADMNKQTLVALKTKTAFINPQFKSYVSPKITKLIASRTWRSATSFSSNFLSDSQALIIKLAEMLRAAILRGLLGVLIVLVAYHGTVTFVPWYLKHRKETIRSESARRSDGSSPTEDYIRILENNVVKNPTERNIERLFQQLRLDDLTNVRIKIKYNRKNITRQHLDKIWRIIGKLTGAGKFLQTVYHPQKNESSAELLTEDVQKLAILLSKTLKEQKWLSATQQVYIVVAPKRREKTQQQQQRRRPSTKMTEIEIPIIQAPVGFWDRLFS